MITMITPACVQPSTLNIESVHNNAVGVVINHDADLHHDGGNAFNTCRAHQRGLSNAQQMHTHYHPRAAPHLHQVDACTEIKTARGACLKGVLTTTSHAAHNLHCSEYAGQSGNSNTMAGKRLC